MMHVDTVSSSALIIDYFYFIDEILLEHPTLFLVDCPFFTVSTSTLFICSMVLREFAVLIPSFL
jgi:hypothetical protein